MGLATPAWSSDIWRTAFQDYIRAQQVTDREVAAALQRAAQDAMAIEGHLAGIEGVGADLRRAQINASMGVLDQISEGMWHSVGQSVTNGLTAASQPAVEAQEAMLSRLMGTGIERSLAESMLMAARQAVENVRSRLLNNIPISREVTKNSRWARSQMQERINNGIALNKSAKEIAADIVDLINPNTPGGASFAALRIGRTELNNAFHTTTTRAVANRPWNEGVHWNLSGSHPRPDECNQYAQEDVAGLGPGNFPTDSVPGKPHPNCLCYITVIPVSFKVFRDNLLGGRYDSFLVSQGQSAVTR